MYNTRMRTKNNIRIKFVIEVKDTYSNHDCPPFWLPYSTLQDPPNPSMTACKLALKFAKERAKTIIGTSLDPDDPSDNSKCIKSEWQIVKRTITEEIIDMDEVEQNE